MFLTQVEIWWSVGVKVPEGVRPSPANRGQLGMNVHSTVHVGRRTLCNLIPRTSHRPVFDHLQYVGDLVMCTVYDVMIDRQGGGSAQW